MLKRKQKKFLSNQIIILKVFICSFVKNCENHISLASMKANFSITFLRAIGSVYVSFL